MRSFRKLATLVALMLFASQEAVALPQPQVPNAASNTIGSVGNQVGVATGNINPSSVNGGNRPFPGFPGFPSFPGYPFPGYPGVHRIPSANTAASTVGSAGNQVGVASGNINPGSVNARDEIDLEARQYYPGYYYPSYGYGYNYPPVDFATHRHGHAAHQHGHASDNNDSDNSDDDSVEKRQVPPNFASSGINSVGNQVGVASGNISPNSFNGGRFPTFPGFTTYPTYPGFPGFPSFPGNSGNSATSTVGTAGNQVGVTTGNVSPTSVNAREELGHPGYYPGN